MILVFITIGFADGEDAELAFAVVFNVVTVAIRSIVLLEPEVVAGSATLLPVTADACDAMGLIAIAAVVLALCDTVTRIVLAVRGGMPEVEIQWRKGQAVDVDGICRSHCHRTGVAATVAIRIEYDNRNAVESERMEAIGSTCDQDVGESGNSVGSFVGEAVVVSIQAVNNVKVPRRES